MIIIRALAVVVCLVSSSLSTAFADGDSAEATSSGYVVGTEQLEVVVPQSDDVASVKKAVPVTILVALAGACIGMPTGCEVEPDGPSRLMPESRILRAFRRIPLPDSRIMIQPPGGKTLVNLETLFRTEADEFTRVVRLLGVRVELRIEPTSFEWVTGDGTRFTTSTPGIAYQRGLPMDSYVFHKYVDAGVTVHPRVNTTWSATYRVGSGPWRDVVGTVTKIGVASDLRVAEARPVLVAGY